MFACWPRIVATSSEGHYGRPFAFHQQAQRADWAATWSKVDAPVLALYGEYDWFESRGATSLITRIVNAKSPGCGILNHHFAQYPNAIAAFAENEGQVNPGPAVSAMLDWLKRILAALSASSPLRRILSASFHESFAVFVDSLCSLMFWRVGEKNPP